MNGFWPRISHRWIYVWMRNRDAYLKTFRVNFLPPLLEPLLYLFALGFGLGTFVQDIQGVPYVVYIAPALVAITTMYNAFFECTYNSFVRMYYEKTFDAIITTPVNLDEVVAGEILWGATKAMINALLVLAVVAAFRLAHWPHSLLVLPLSLVGGFVFAAIALLFTAVVPTIDSFNYPFYLYITPMFLFSGTFFPLEVLPKALQGFAWAALPLTHVVYTYRLLMFGQLSWGLLWSTLWMLAVGFGAFFLSVHLMRRRLIV